MRKILALFLVVVVLLTVSACGGESLPAAEEIIDGSLQAQNDIRSYEFEMDVTIDMSGEADGEAFEATILMDYSGALDLDNEEMRMAVTAKAIVPDEDEAETALEAYLVDGIGYTKTSATETEPVWEKDEFSEEDWAETWESVVEVMSLATPQLELLEAAEVKVIGSESVQGVDCYVLKLTPDMKQLWDTMMQQATMSFGGGLGLPELTQEIFDEASYSLSVKQWLAKDSYFLMKVEIDTSIELTAEMMQVTEGEMTMDTFMKLLAYNYNQPVSIELPPEAEAALEN